MIHPDIIQIAREEDLKAWRERERERIHRRQRVKSIARLGYWAGVLVLIGWATWDGVTRISDGLLW